MSAAYPVAWRVLDAVEKLVASVWSPRWNRFLPLVFLLPAILVVGLLVAGLATMLDHSFRALDPNTYRLAETYSLTNYLEAFGSKVFIAVSWRSLLASVIVTILTLLLALPYAYVMARTPSPALRRFLLISLFLPFLIGQVVRAYGWLVLLGNEGLLNQAFGLVGLGPFKMIYTYPAVVFGLVQYMLPFAVLMLAPAMAAIPEEIELASESLGATWTETFRHVVVPMAKPGLVGAGIVVFTLTLTDFAMPAILGGGTNDFIANAIYDAFFRISDAGLGSARSILLVLLGSTIVGVVFALLGAGTLGFRSRAS
jgi:putative spermidine/putrescine transport system permease protein